MQRDGTHSSCRYVHIYVHNSAGQTHGGNAQDELARERAASFVAEADDAGILGTVLAHEV